MADSFRIVVTGIVIISLVGILIVLFSLTEQNNEPSVLSSLGTITATNITTFESFVSGDQLPNGTSTLIRSTPSFSCNNVYMQGEFSNQTDNILSLTIANGNTVTAGETEILCSTNGTVRLFLAGNSSNSSSNPNGIFYNISYTAKRYDASWNVTKEVQGGLWQAGRNQTTFYTLIILVLVLSLGATIFFFRDNVGGNGFGGGGFKIGNPLDSFER